MRVIIILDDECIMLFLYIIFVFGPHIYAYHLYYLILIYVTVRFLLDIEGKQLN